MEPRLAAALGEAVRRRKHDRFRDFVDESHPDYDPAWIPQLFRLAGMELPDEYRYLLPPEPEPARLSESDSQPPPGPVVEVAPGLNRHQAVMSMAMGCPNLDSVPKQLGCGCNGLGFCQAGVSPDPRGIVGLGDCIGCVERHDREGKPWPPPRLKAWHG